MNNRSAQTEVPGARCRVCGDLLDENRLGGLCPACTWQSFSDLDSEEQGALLSSEPSLLNVPGYVVLEEIARGGMGIVYRARQLQPARTVALKMLLPHQLGSADMRQRFNLETRAIAGLEHPAILPVYSVGDYDGMPFFTMKLATGGTLAARRDQFRKQFRKIAELIATLADAVQFAHQHGVLHRDLKPGNILFDETDRCYISDFGLAKFTASDSSVTASVNIMGTPQYLAPEVARHGARGATTGADIYSLGAILYELLTGAAPHRGKNLVEVLRCIADEPPVSPRKIVSNIPRDLEVICLHCLQKEPGERYLSAAEFAEDLRRWLEGRTIKARPGAPAERIWRWARRNPALATVSALLIVGSVLGGLVLTRSNRHLAVALGESKTALADSLIMQARLERASGRRGQHVETLNLIKRATGLMRHNSQSPNAVDLRSEIAGALALPDLLPVARWPVYVGHYEASVGFSDDLSRYAAGKPDGGFAVYSTSDRRELYSAAGSKENPPVKFKLSRDQQWIAVTFQDGQAEVHSLEKRQTQITFPGRQNVLTDVEFLPDNQHVLVAGSSMGVFKYDLLHGTSNQFIAPPAIASAVTADPEGKVFAVSSQDQLQAFRIVDGAKLWSKPHAGMSASGWSPDGNRLAAANGKLPFEVVVLDVKTGNAVETFQDYEVPVGKVVFHPDGRSIFMSGWDGRLLWRELGKGGFRFLSEAGPRLLQISSDGTRLAYGPSHGEVGIYEVIQPSIFHEWRRLSVPDEETFMIAVKQNGRYVATSTARGVHLWDIQRREEVSVIPLPARMWYVMLVFHPDGKSLLYSAVGIGINQVELIPPDPGEKEHGRLIFGKTRRLVESTDLIALEFTADGRSLIVGENKKKTPNERRSPDMWLWPGADPARARKLAGNWPLVGYHLTRDGRWGLTSDSTAPDITVWNPTTGERVRGLGFTRPVGFELTPDGEWLLALTQGEHQLVKIGTWERGKSWKAVDLDQHNVHYTFSPDSRLIASSGARGSIDLRTLPEAREIIHLPTPRATELKDVKFSADGKKLFRLNNTGGMEEWDLAKLRQVLKSSGLDWDSQ